ncbi:hypothetical protein QHI69_37305 [Burkholderia gladioli pv. gladioli]|uniref:Uncharacterized protein n=1 Tax=Burkholderia gladioli TaxID=28095 RepID=A0AAW3F7W6_BURGA|nr:hypothetical protein [Burkholderia gladioli]AJW93696.1 hypothetical protein BM43_7370 [Burkholderia gladioli]ASD84727.1 hypothetical protein CEJ98_37890 [Burkholderia gladioli pv. gladioli]AWY49753.1 hypothetical protein A8H28_00330 [Burkholderia gladioli pv. gladioli]KGC16793.1 hypothetical protein DM48_3269 [Burkholderia gladioli]MDJ1167587.1 hypothetical protein [Burkholderia gladioli pv. gladioli]
MSLTHFLIRTLTRLDGHTVARVISTAAAQDEPTAQPPAEFRQGRTAMAYALATFIGRRPVQFYVGLSGLIALPIYLVGTLVGDFYGW